MNRLSLLVAALLPFAAIASDNLLRNASFEKSDAQKLPAEWKFSPDKNVDVSLEAVPGGGPGGEPALALVNRSPHGPRAALRQFLPLRPGTTYELSCLVKGKAGGYLSFALGSKWQNRLWLRGGDDWTEYRMKFSPAENEFSWKNAYEICLLTEENCDVRIARLRLEETDPAELLVNGDFGSVSPDGLPGGWKLTIDKGMNA